MDRLDIVRTVDGHVYTIECEWSSQREAYSIISRTDGDLHDTQWCEAGEEWQEAMNTLMGMIAEIDDTEQETA